MTTSPRPPYSRALRRARAQLQRIEPRRLVDEDGRFVQLSEGRSEAVPIARIEPARAQLLRVDPADRSEEAKGKLRGAHFHREEEHGKLELEADVLGHVEREARLAHARAARDDDEVAVLQARGHLVEVDEPGGLAGDRRRIAMQLVQAVHHVGEDVRHLREAFGGAPPGLADLEDARLGLVEELARLAPLRAVRAVGDRRADLGELAHDGALADDLGIAADIGRARRAGSELVQVREAAYVLDLAGRLERFRHGKDVGRLVVLDEPRDRAPQQAVVVAVEIGLVDDVADAIPRRVAEQQPAENRLLGLDRVRRQAQRFDLGVAGGRSGEAFGSRGHLGLISSRGGSDAPKRRKRRVCHPRPVDTTDKSVD